MVYLLFTTNKRGFFKLASEELAALGLVSEDHTRDSIPA